MPSWMQNLMPGGSKLPTPPPPANKGGGSDDQREAAKRLQELDKNKNMSIQDYVEHCRTMRLQNDPPIPQFPPLPPSHHDWMRFIDMQRMAWLRVYQHEKIGGMFSDADIAEVTSRGKDIQDDQQFLTRIADRTGLYIDLEVQDFLKKYFSTRDNFRWLHRWVKAGRPYPRSWPEHDRVYKYEEGQEKREEIEVKLKKRDRKNCPVIPRLKWLGTECTCSLTGLKFFECCGNRNPAMQPRKLLYQGPHQTNKGKTRRKTLPRHWQKWMHVVEAHNSVVFRFDNWWHDETHHVRRKPSRRYDK